jgi:hypothetical protein
MILDRHHLILYGAGGLLAVIGGVAYHLKSLDVAKAEAKVAAQETVIAASEKRIADREEQFKDQLAQILAMKSTPATTPAQIVERIPQYFPQLQPQLVPQVNPQTGQTDTSKPPLLVFDPPQAKILNDTLVDCKVCSIERDKLKLDLADQKSVTAERTKEVETWKTAAKGGSIWKRAGRVAKWLAIGGAIGYVVAKH